MRKLFISVVALFAVCSLSAQNGLYDIYDQAIAAYNAKDFATAAKGLEAVVEQGVDSEDADEQSWVATAKTYIPQSYFMLGGGAIKGGDYPVAIGNFEKAANAAALYGDLQMERKAKMWVANAYLKWGATPFNAKNYTEAVDIFAKGYAADPKNMEMANLLAICYCELGDYQKGLAIFSEVASQDNPKFADDVAKAKENIKLYSNNRIAKLQAAADFDGIIAVAEQMLATNEQDALAHKIRLQAYFDKKDYTNVIASAEAAAAAQTDPADRSDVYFILGAAYNARTMTPQAIEAFKKVTAGQNVAVAKQSVTQLTTAPKAN